MSRFSIDEVAIDEIHRIFRQSRCRDPVAKLYERADPGSLFDDVKAALLSNAKTKKELEAMGKKRFEQVGSKLESSLMVSAQERSGLQSEYLHEINGVTFAIGSDVLKALRDYRLTFENGKFWLRGPDNVAHTLRSLPKPG